MWQRMSVFSYRDKQPEMVASQGKLLMGSWEVVDEMTHIL